MLPMPGSRCMKGLLSRTTWDDAFTACSDSGGQLITLDTIEKNEAAKFYLTNYAPNKGKC